ncbi:phosphotransferase [Sorangium sp. So ce726]|uniref:phosphotransferase n=1 Tax=Sorangium sp. So ce726 TaxID=3133319 RepID=UPI003F627A78
MVHRDLKPENVLLAEQDGERVAKVVDLGLAHVAPRVREFGSPAHVNPLPRTARLHRRSRAVFLDPALQGAAASWSRIGSLERCHV